MKLLALLSCVAVPVVLLLPNQRPTGPIPSAGPGPVPAIPTTRALPASMPTAFVPNQGQWPGDVRYAAQFEAMTVRLLDDGMLVSVLAPAPSPAGSEPTRGCNVRLGFVGANRATIAASDPQPGSHNYFVGARSSWRTEVSRFSRVTYHGLYPGIDLYAYDHGGFEYDLLLAPGAALADVEIAVEGAEALRLEADGAMRIDTAAGPIRQSPPRTFAVGADGQQRPVHCAFVLRGPDRFGFVAPDWDGREALRIDPGLTYSTLFGSNLSPTFAVAVDSAGIITVAGGIGGFLPTTPGAFQTTSSGNADIYVARFDPSLTGTAQLLYATYLGSSGLDEAYDMVVAGNGIVTLVGYSTWTDFPTTANAFQPANAGGMGSSDAVLVRLDPAQAGAAQLLYSTYLGGTGNDAARSLLVGANGVVTLTGTARPGGFPVTAGAYDTSHNGLSDVFVVRLDPNQAGAAQLLYSTFYGGNNLDQPLDMAIAANGALVIAGYTDSTNLPLVQAYDTALGGASDGFLLRLDPGQAGSQQLTYATYLGGPSFEEVAAVAVDQAGLITVAGGTGSATFPVTALAHDTTFSGSSDAFVTRLDPQQPPNQQLVWSTFLGGPNAGFASGSDGIVAMVVDGGGAVTVVGTTDSPSFPATPGAFDPTFNGNFDGFVSRLDPNLPGPQQLVYSTCLGGAALSDRPWALALDARGAAIVVGITSSIDFPITPGAYSTASGFSNADGFLARIDMLPTGASSFGQDSAGCTGAVIASVTSQPRVGNTAFQFRCSGAPPNALGVLGLATGSLTSALQLFQVGIWIDPTTLLQSATVTSSAGGGSYFPVPIPNVPSLAGAQLTAQWLWFGPNSPPPCPAQGVSASQGLAITIQP